MLKESLLGWGGQKDRWPIKSKHELILLSNDAFTSVSPSMYTFFEDEAYHSKTNKTEYWWTATTSSDNHNSCYTFSRNPSVGDVIYFTDGDITTATITDAGIGATHTLYGWLSDDRNYTVYTNTPEKPTTGAILYNADGTVNQGFTVFEATDLPENEFGATNVNGDMVVFTRNSALDIADSITTSENRSYRYDHIAYPNVPERFTIPTGLTSRNSGTYPDRIVSDFDIASGTYIFIGQDQYSKQVSVTQMNPNTFEVMFHEVVTMNNTFSTSNPNVQPFWKDIENGIYAWTSNGFGHSGMYRWYNSSPNKAYLYTPSESPAVGDILYNSDGTDSNDRVTAIVTNAAGVITGIRNSQNYLYNGPYENPTRIENPKVWIFNSKTQKVISIDLADTTKNPATITELVGMWVPPFQDVVNKLFIVYKSLNTVEADSKAFFAMFSINLNNKTSNRIYDTNLSASTAVGLAMKTNTSFPHFIYIDSANSQIFTQFLSSDDPKGFFTHVKKSSLSTGLYLEDSKLSYGTLTNLGGYAPNRSAVSTFSGSTRYFQMTSDSDGTLTLKDISLSPAISNGTTSGYLMEPVCKYSTLIRGLVSSSAGYQLSYNNDQYSSRLIPLTSDNGSSVITDSSFSSISVYSGYNKFSILASTSANKIWQNINLYSSKPAKLYEWYNGDGLVNIYTTTKEPDSNSILYSESGVPYTSQQARVDSFMDGDLNIEGQLLSGVWNLTAFPDTTKDVIFPKLVDISNNRNPLYNVTQARVMGISEVEPRNQKDDYYGTFFPIIIDKAPELLALSAKDDPSVLIYVQDEIAPGKYAVDGTGALLKTENTQSVHCYKSSQENHTTIYTHGTIKTGDKVYNRDGTPSKSGGRYITIRDFDNPSLTWITLTTGLKVWRNPADDNPSGKYIKLVKLQNEAWITSEPYMGYTEFVESSQNNYILRSPCWWSMKNSGHYNTKDVNPGDLSSTHLIYQDDWPLGKITNVEKGSGYQEYTHTVETSVSSVTIRNSWEECSANPEWLAYRVEIDPSISAPAQFSITKHQNLINIYEAVSEANPDRLAFYSSVPNNLNTVNYYPLESSDGKQFYIKNKNPMVGDIVYTKSTYDTLIFYQIGNIFYTSEVFTRNIQNPVTITSIENGIIILSSSDKCVQETHFPENSLEFNITIDGNEYTYQIRKQKTRATTQLRIGYQIYGDKMSANSTLYYCSLADEYQTLFAAKSSRIDTNGLWDTQKSSKVGPEWFIDGENLRYSFLGQAQITTLPEGIPNFYPYFRSE